MIYASQINHKSQIINHNMDKEIFLNVLKERILILDGGMGTMVQGFKLTEKDYRGKQFADWTSDLKGNNDLLCITRPDVIKSIRLGKASLVDTFCIVEKGELWVKNMYVAEYFYGTYNNHTTRRDRKLLLTKKELRKIESAARNNGFTIIPTRLFINEKGLAKVVVAIAKGKKEYDKRDSIKERDDRREMDRAFKQN